MADRIEYQGIPLPSGLPGFGGGTVQILTLPGFNTVVAPPKFGPVVDAEGAATPDPDAPPGSNPDDPTDDVVNPGPAPSGPGGPFQDERFSNLCSSYDCASDPDLNQPLVFAQKAPDPICVSCKKPGAKYYPNFFTASSTSVGVYYVGADHIQGKASGSEWNIRVEGFETNKDSGYFKIGQNEFSSGAKLDKDKVIISGTEYRKGAKIYDIDTGRTYEPKALDVCVGSETKTWYVLAYEQ